MPKASEPQKMYLSSKSLALVLAAILGLLWVLSSRNTPSSPPDKKTVASATAPKASADTNGWAQASLVLKDLIQTHPVEEIRTDMFRTIDSGQMAISFQEDLFEHTSAMASMGIVQMSRGLVPVLTVGYKQLMDPHLSKVFKQLVIYHEYQHFKQYKRGSVKATDLMPMSIDTKLSPDDVRRWFASENEAYGLECQLAISLRATNEFELCKLYEQGGAKAVAKSLVETYANIKVYAPHTELMRQLAEAY
jgi:hypothetical protein